MNVEPIHKNYYPLIDTLVSRLRDACFSEENRMPFAAVVGAIELVKQEVMDEWAEVGEWDSR